MGYTTSYRDNFLNELCSLDPAEMARVAEKLKVLNRDPSPDGDAKKRLKYLKGKLHRLRAGSYRVIYTDHGEHGFRSKVSTVPGEGSASIPCTVSAGRVSWSRTRGLSVRLAAIRPIARPRANRPESRATSSGERRPTHA